MTACCSFHCEARPPSLDDEPPQDLRPVAAADLPVASWPLNLVGVVVSTHSGTREGLPRRVMALCEQPGPVETKRSVAAELAMGLQVSPGDRVLIAMPANASLGVVTSLLARAGESPPPCETRPAAPSSSSPNGQSLVLRDEESLCVTTATGQTLIAIERGAGGPIIRLGADALELDMPGELRLVADSLRLTTRRGPISIESQTDDVIVQGRVIRLN